jgi:hypothetical protein
MLKSGRVYLTLGIIFLASMTAAVLLPFGDELRVVTGIPVVGALFAALLQVLRDAAAHEKALLLQGLHVVPGGRRSELWNTHRCSITFGKSTRPG